MKRWQLFLVVFWLAFVVSALITDRVMARQEHDQSYPQTRAWQVAHLERQEWSENGTRIDVVDTAGVCLYIARWVKGVEITAVPKTQLPKGAGCQ